MESSNEEGYRLEEFLQGCSVPEDVLIAVRTYGSIDLERLPPRQRIAVLLNADSKGYYALIDWSAGKIAVVKPDVEDWILSKKKLDIDIERAELTYVVPRVETITSCDIDLPQYGIRNAKIRIDLIVYEFHKVRKWEREERSNYYLFKGMEIDGKFDELKAYRISIPIGVRKRINESLVDQIVNGLRIDTGLQWRKRIVYDPKKPKWDVFYATLVVPVITTVTVEEVEKPSKEEGLELERLKFEEEEEVVIESPKVEQLPEEEAIRRLVGKWLDERGLVRIHVINYDLISEFKGGEYKAVFSPNGTLVESRTASADKLVHRKARQKLIDFLHNVGAFPIAQSFWALADGSNIEDVREGLKRLTEELRRDGVEDIGRIELMEVFMPKEFVVRKLNEYVEERRMKLEELVEKVAKEKKARARLNAELKKLERQLEKLTRQLKALEAT